MTDRLKHPSLKPMAKIALATLLSTCVLGQSSNAAEQEWWFDVEVILFERNLETANISEKFKQSRLEQASGDFIDLLTPYIKPDLSYLRAGLTYCRASNQLAVKTQYEQEFAFPLPVGKTKQSAPVDEQTAVPRPVVLPEDNFEYEVATSDIFTQSNKKGQVPQTFDSEDTHSSTLAQNNNNTLEHQENVALTPKINLPKPAIEVDFIEWQMPGELPCAYAEQIDPSFASISAFQNSGSGDNSEDHIDRVPEIINGIEWQQKRSASLLPTSTMYMTDLYEKIKKQQDISPLLHINWRQQVHFGRKNAATIRLFAGQNYAQQFDANGERRVNDTDGLFDSLNQQKNEFYHPTKELALLSPEPQQGLFAGITEAESSISVDLFARIDQALADDTPINIESAETPAKQLTPDTKTDMLRELWQLDGGITVYLRNVGRIPYLHIDSDLDFRQPIFDPLKTHIIAGPSYEGSEQGAIIVNQLQRPNYLQSANFNQLRRVISKQVHYFDHPLFGMLVRINRYRWPEAENTDR